MKATVSFTVRQSDHTALKKNSEGGASKVLEKAFEDFVNGKLIVSKEDFNTVRTSCCLHTDTAAKIENMAKAMDVPVSKLVRVIAEKAMQTHH